MRRTRKNLLCRAGILSVAGLVASFTQNPLEAATVSWNNAAGGNWSGPNWTGGVGTNPPTSSDAANFAIANTYNVTLDISPSINNLTVAGSTVTYLNSTIGRTLTTTLGVTVNSGSLTLNAAQPIAITANNNSSFNNNFSIFAGSDFSGTNVSIGTTQNGTTLVDGAGSTLNASGGISIGQGIAKTGTLTLQNGATSSGGSLTMAIFQSGTGILNVLSGADLTTNTIRMSDNAIASQHSSTTISGAGSTLSNVGNISIGSSGTNSATMLISNSAAVSSSGLNSLAVGSSGLLDIQSGGTFTIFSQPVFVTSGSGSEGKILVSGAGSSFSQTGNVGVGVGGTSGNIATIQTSSGGSFSTGTAQSNINATGLVDIVGGTFSANGNLVIEGTLQRGSAGTFTWAGSKTMTVQNGGDVNITGALSLPSSATVNLTGAGSTFNTSSTLTIPAGSSLAVSSSGALSVGSLAGAGGISSSSTILTGSDNLSTSFSGAISGAGGLSKSGTGVQTLSGASTYSGGTTINGGTISVSADNNLGNSGGGITFNTGTLATTLSFTTARAVALSSNGSFDVSSGTTLSASGVFSGSGALTKAGAGTLTLSGANTRTGQTSVIAGTLTLQHSTAAGSGAIIQTSTAAQTIVEGGISVANSITIAGGGPTATGGTSPGSLGALHSAAGTNTWAGTITLSGAGSNVGNVDLNEISADLGSTLTITGLIQDGPPGSDAWGKNRLGDVVLSGASPNTYTGITRTFHGTLIIEKDGALGAAGSTTTADGNTFMLNATGATGTSTIAFRAPASSPAGFTYNTEEWLNTGGNATTGTGAQLDNLGGDNIFAGKVGLGGFLSGGFIQSSIGVTAGSLELSDSIYASGSAPFDPREITKLGPGTLIISGTSSGPPTNTVNNGSLVNSKFVIPAGTVRMQGLLPGVTMYDVNGGTLHVIGGEFIPASVVARTGGQVNFTGGITHVGALDVQTTGAAAIVAGAAHTIQVDTITVANTFDMTDNKMVVHTTPVGSWNGSAYTGVTGMIQAGRGDGTWNGLGIRTSMTDATTGVLTTLAVARADETGHDGGTFGNVSVSGDDVLVMYTWGGDADLNGELNGDDYFYLDSNILANQAGANNASFHNGDFDYSGALDGDDYFILDSNILQAQASAPFPTGAGSTGSLQAGAGLTAIPEPASLALAALASSVLLRRRARRGTL